MGGYRFELAKDDDDAELRRVLAATPMPGRVSVTFQREPSYFEAAVVDGTFRQTVSCREGERDQIIGFGSRSVREMSVNGTATPIGYLSMLRVLSEHRNMGLVARGYRYFRTLHGDGRTELYLTTIAEGNERAISMLASGRAGLPSYHPAGMFHTVAIPIVKRSRRAQPAGTSADVRPATNADLDALLEFLERVGPDRQFFPRYRASDFFDSEGAFRDLRPSDVLLAFRNGRLVGTLGGWDQHRFRQTVVDEYAGPLRWARPLHNCLARVRGRPELPRPGEAFRYMTAALPVVEADDRQVFAALLETLLASAVGSECDYLLLGLHEADALLPSVIRRGTASYLTRLYHVCWEDGETLRNQLDERPPYLELGCL